jgi:hypothetical protein
MLPPLTTIRQPLEKLGEKAFELLLAKMCNEEVVSETTIGIEMVVRQSCGCLPLAVRRVQMQSPVWIDQDHGEPLPTQKEVAQEIWLQALDPVLPQAPAWKEKWIPDLLSACFDEVVAGKSGTFLQTVNFICQQSALQKQNLDHWHLVFSVLRSQITPYLKTVEQTKQVENLWQQAQILLSDLLQQAQVRSRLHADLRTHLLFEINEEVITTFDLPKLMNVLSNALQQLEISFCFLCLNDMPNTVGLENLPEKSRLIMGYQDGERRQLNLGGIQFSTEKLLPDEILADQDRFDALVISLRFQNRYLGHAVFEMGKRDGFVYDALQIQISSALRGA